jgi:hypothetical protein
MRFTLIIALVGLLLNLSISQEKLSDREKALKILREHFNKEREAKRKIEHELVKDYSLMFLQSYPKDDVSNVVLKHAKIPMSGMNLSVGYGVCMFHIEAVDIGENN